MEHSASNESNQAGSGNGAHGLASRAEGKLHDIGDKARERLEAQRDRVASNIETAASRVRQRGDAAGPIGHKAGELAAVRMEAAAGYLHEHESAEIVRDVEAHIRRHPIQSVFIAAVLGYVVGRILG